MRYYGSLYLSESNSTHVQTNSKSYFSHTDEKTTTFILYASLVKQWRMCAIIVLMTFSDVMH